MDFFDSMFISLYLGYIPDGLDTDDSYLLKILLAVSKKTIIKNWLQKNCRTVELFISTVKQLHLLEQMTYSLRLQKDLGGKRWGKWIAYFNSVTDL